MSDDRNVGFYDASYGNFDDDLYQAIRTEVFGDDIGQNGWLTADEHDRFIAALNVGAGNTVLDVACGSGGPTLRIASTTGCDVVGIDIHEQGVAAAVRKSRRAGLEKHARFEVVDGGKALPFDDSAFDGLICIDAVNHLPGREAVFADWHRVLAPGGRLVFTDPIVVTGPLTGEEMRIRSSIGFFLFVPAGYNERLLEEAGFFVNAVEDRTENMALMARKWLIARERRAEKLKQMEGEETFSQQQDFFRVAAVLAEERRLSRFAVSAMKKG